jgi:hypothetical protein
MDSRARNPKRTLAQGMTLMVQETLGFQATDVRVANMIALPS